MGASPETATEADRRAWRIALLLTGDAGRADAVMVRVLAAQPELEAIPPSRRDRLVLLRARETMAGGARKPPIGLLERVRTAHLQRRGDEEAAAQREGVFSGVANALLQFSLRTPHQRHEALMLHRVEGMDLRETARAMDCSTTAAARHIEAAEQAVAEAMGQDYTRASAMLRAQAREAAPGPSVLRTRRVVLRRRRWRRIAMWITTLALLGAVAWGAWWLLRRSP